MLENLYQDLEEKNRSYVAHPPSPQSAKTESTGLFDTFRRAISGKVRSHSVDSHLGHASSTTSSASGRRLAAVTSPPVLPPLGEHVTQQTTPVLRPVVTITAVCLSAWL